MYTWYGDVHEELWMKNSFLIALEKTAAEDMRRFTNIYQRFSTKKPNKYLLRYTSLDILSYIRNLTYLTFILFTFSSSIFYRANAVISVPLQLIKGISK